MASASRKPTDSMRGSAASPAARLACPGPLDILMEIPNRLLFSNLMVACTCLHPHPHNIILTTPSDHRQRLANFITSCIPAKLAAMEATLRGLPCRNATPPSTCIISRWKHYPYNSVHRVLIAVTEGLEALIPHLQSQTTVARSLPDDNILH